MVVVYKVVTLLNVLRFVAVAAFILFNIAWVTTSVLKALLETMLSLCWSLMDALMEFIRAPMEDLAWELGIFTNEEAFRFIDRQDFLDHVRFEIIELTEHID